MAEPIGPQLDFETAPLAGTVLVEASAGTGKTWTIAALVLRLLLEERGPDGRWKIEDILVVTYTNAATAELRERILGLLVAARKGLETGAGDDPRVRHALKVTSGRREAACDDLDLAIASFDLAPIHTIHGFCQRALAENAFESGRQFDAEILVDETALRVAAAEDFWRREMAHVEADRAAYLLRELNGPSGLLARATPALDRPYAALLDVEPPPDLRAITARARAAFARARALWTDARDTIASQIERAGLKRNSYPPDHLAEWWASFDGYFAGAPFEPLPKRLAKLAPQELAKGKTKAGALPLHPFFESVAALLDARAELDSASVLADVDLIARFLDYCRDELGRRKRERGQQSYDDLLLGLRGALRAAGGADLAAALRSRYKAALIDEFQDTDPIQAEVLERIWGGSGQPLYFIGDPKQAIYGFRGADVFAYLRLRQGVSARYTLGVNQRSDAPLLDAIAAFFNAPKPFLIEAIDFTRARPSDRARPRLAIDDAAKPLTVWHVEKRGDENKEAVRRRVAAAVASDIARLLELSRSGKATILRPDGGARPLAMSDIAVLVSKHADGDIVRDALARAGLASVTYGADSVYESREAEELERILRAVAEPGRETLLRAALATEPFGLDAPALAALAADGADWEGWVTRFREYHDLARTHGFVRMWRELARREGVAERLLAYPDGERRMTNVAHLVELLHDRANREGLDLAQLSRALAHAQETLIRDPDVEQLRLESDEHLVNIVTVFRAKGLEYPVVYCPFLWDGAEKSGRESAVVFHPQGPEGDATVDLGGPHAAANRRLAAAEELAGRLRLAYVALTRAQHRCTVAWGALPNADTSAPAWLLHAPATVGDDPVADLARAFQRVDDEAIAARLDRLVADADGAIAVAPLPDGATRSSAAGPTPPEPLVARAFDGSVAPAWRISSFSGLVARATDERPDYDSMRGSASEARQAGAADAFGMPGGVRLGTALHKVLEALDFRGADAAQIDTAVRRELARAGIADTWVEVATRVVVDVLATPLDQSGFRLRDVALADRVDELEFTYPVRSVPAGALAAAVAPLRALRSRIPEAIGSLVLAPSRGFMRGYIDLVFARDGRFFIVDYKSNWLGDTLEDYAPPRLQAAMADAFYDLQYLVYTVALHRLLASRVADYAYERHFGGVYYLFLRGMRPEHGPSFGVHFTRPAAALVADLDACLAPDGPVLAPEAHA